MEVVEQAIEQIIKYVQDQPDPATGAWEATQMQKRLSQLVSTVAELRASYVRMLFSQGWSLAQIAETCGITKSRVEQIVKR